VDPRVPGNLPDLGVSAGALTSPGVGSDLDGRRLGAAIAVDVALVRAFGFVAGRADRVGGLAASSPTPCGAWVDGTIVVESVVSGAALVLLGAALVLGAVLGAALGAVLGAALVLAAAEAAVAGATAFVQEGAGVVVVSPAPPVTVLPVTTTLHELLALTP